ncbi:MAG: hypothetical protein ACFFCW_10825 [Candidatus Hodarchaeota archaeon]
MLCPIPAIGQNVEATRDGKLKIFYYLLMAEDVGHILSMILVPRASGDLFSTLLSDGIINDKKPHATNLDSQRIEQPPQGDLHELLLSPGVFCQKSGEA